MTTAAYFAEIGGTRCLERVHHILYDKLLSHAWLKQFFGDRERWHLESQQTDFMTGILGGPKVYGGRTPMSAHMHLYITEEIFALRHEMLAQSLIEAGVPQHLHDVWLNVDGNMKRALVKQSPEECRGRYNNEAVINVPKPDGA